MEPEAGNWARLGMAPRDWAALLAASREEASPSEPMRMVFLPGAALSWASVSLVRLPLRVPAAGPWMSSPLKPFLDRALSLSALLLRFFFTWSLSPCQYSTAFSSSANSWC